MNKDPKVDFAKGNENAHLVYSTIDTYILFKLTSKFETSLAMAATTYLDDINENP